MDLALVLAMIGVGVFASTYGSMVGSAGGFIVMPMLLQPSVGIGRQLRRRDPEIPIRDRWRSRFRTLRYSRSALPNFSGYRHVRFYSDFHNSGRPPQSHSDGHLRRR